MKILHVFPGTLAFTDCVIRLFEKTEHENEYICLIHTDDLRGSELAKAKTKLMTHETMQQYCAKTDARAIMFHSLPHSFYDAVLAVDPKKTIIASTWGYDIYESQSDCPPVCPMENYKPLTKRMLPARAQHAFSIRNTVKSLYHRTVIRSKNRQKQNAALGRIDYWATVLPVEYDLIQENAYCTGSYFPFQYSDPDEDPYSTFEDATSPLHADGWLLIGNSATSTNNHLDILEELRRKNISNPVYMPMAYGRSDYVKVVEEYLSTNKFNYFIQKDFLPLHQFRDIFGHAQAAIYGNIRQQAMGNICLSLTLGLKTFFWKNSIVYNFLKKTLGCEVFNIEDDLSQETLLAPLEKEKQLTNRNLIAQLFSPDFFLPQMRKVLDIIEKETGRIIR